MEVLLGRRMLGSRQETEVVHRRRLEVVGRHILQVEGRDVRRVLPDVHRKGDWRCLLVEDLRNHQQVIELRAGVARHHTGGVVGRNRRRCGMPVLGSLRIGGLAHCSLAGLHCCMLAARCRS